MRTKTGLTFRGVPGIAVLVLLTAIATLAQQNVDSPRNPVGTLVDIGGQRLHLFCTGAGSPTVLLESGTGDISVIWSLVQPGVSKFTRVCSYDRGGYAWSDPGTQPRTFAQLALELDTALNRLHVGPPYVLVGQSYGGLAVRGFARRYGTEVSGMVLVDAVHEDQHIVYGGQPHRIQDSAQGLEFPTPQIGLNKAMLERAQETELPRAEQVLEFPLNKMPAAAQRIWRWANSLPLLGLAQNAELEWSPEEFAFMHKERLSNRATLGDIPLIVLAKTRGGFADGMSMSAENLERERRELQADLARLSHKGKLVFAANSGHNIHLEDPVLVINSIREVVDRCRRTRQR